MPEQHRLVRIRTVWYQPLVVAQASGIKREWWEISKPNCFTSLNMNCSVPTDANLSDITWRHKTNASFCGSPLNSRLRLNLNSSFRWIQNPFLHLLPFGPWLWGVLQSTPTDIGRRPGTPLSSRQFITGLRLKTYSYTHSHAHLWAIQNHQLT